MKKQDRQNFEWSSDSQKVQTFDWEDRLFGSGPTFFLLSLSKSRVFPKPTYLFPNGIRSPRFPIWKHFPFFISSLITPLWTSQVGKSDAGCLDPTEAKEDASSYSPTPRLLLLLLLPLNDSRPKSRAKSGAGRAELFKWLWLMQAHFARLRSTLSDLFFLFFFFSLSLLPLSRLPELGQGLDLTWSDRLCVFCLLLPSTPRGLHTSLHSTDWTKQALRHAEEVGDPKGYLYTRAGFFLAFVSCLACAFSCLLTIPSSSSCKHKKDKHWI